MFWLLGSSAYPESRTFQSPVLYQWACAHNAMRKHSQHSWPELARGIFQKDIKCGEFVEGCQLLLKNRLCISQQVVSNCLVHHLFLLHFITLCHHCSCYFLLLLLIIIINIIHIIILYSVSIIELFFSQPTKCWSFILTITREESWDVSKWLSGT